MLSKFHGVFSIGMLSVAFMLGLTAIFVNSLWLGLLYAIVIVGASLSIVYAYCAKCPVRLTSCSHVVVGPLTQIFPPRKQGTYTKTEYGVVAISLAVLLLFPQYWLFQHQGLLIAFWVLVVAALIEINRFVCSKCENSYCFACKNKNQLKNPFI